MALSWLAGAGFAMRFARGDGSQEGLTGASLGRNRYIVPCYGL